jgi:phosphate transport system protein
VKGESQVKTGHLEAALQHDLEQIREKVGEMGRLATVAVRESIRAVVEKDRQLAFAVILRDGYIDQAEKELDHLCLEFLVRHQPAASLLRFAYATIKISLELERVGDYAEAIAREAIKLAQVEAPLPIDRLQQIVDLAAPMLRDSVKAFLSQEPELAKQTIETDEAVDLLRDSLSADLTQAFRDGELPFEALLPLIMVARRLERVSDQARNIGMETLYLCTGQMVKHPGSEVLAVLFVDEHNACRSVMAETIGRSLGLAGFDFASAGLDPRPVASATTRFMASKGYDIQRVAPRALTDVENLDYFDVVVLLASEARRVFPRRPRKAVLLEWPVASPEAAQGSGPEVAASYQATYAFIEGQIRDLVSAIQDHNQS